MAEPTLRKSSDTASTRRGAGSIKQNETYASAHELEAQSTLTQEEKGNDSAEGQKIGDAEQSEEEEEMPQPPESVAEIIRRIHLYLWWLLGVLLLAIPLIISHATLRSVRLDGIRLEGLFIWLEIVWTVLWASYFFAWCLGKGLEKTFDSLNLEGYSDFFNGLRLPLMLLLTSIIAWATTSRICKFGNGNCNAHWLTIFRKILLATIPVTAIFFVKTAVIEMIVARCATAVLFSKKKILERGINGMYALTNQLEDAKAEPPLRRLINKVREKFTELGGWSYVFLDTKRHPDYQLFIKYLAGEGKDEEFVGENDIEPIYRRVFLGGISDEALKAISIKPKNWKPGTKRKLRISAAELIQMFDHDGNKEISLLEFMKGAVDIMRCTRDVMKGIRGVQGAAFSVDLVVSAIMVIIIALIYAAFFTHNINAYFTPLWTTFTGISFALGGTVTEFFTCCAFVFSKQPYSVGDRVTIEGKDDGDLIVDQVYLTYTVFHRVKDGVQDQLTNMEANSKWIANVSRSRNRKENFVVAAGLNLTPQDERRLEEEIRKYIQEIPGCSRYLQSPSINIRLNGDQQWEVQAEMAYNSQLGHVEAELAKHRDAVVQKLFSLVKELHDERASSSSAEPDSQSVKEVPIVSAEEQQDVDKIEPVGLIQRKISSSSKASKTSKK